MLRAAVLSRRFAVVAPVVLLLLPLMSAAGQTPPRRDFKNGMRTGIGYTAAMPDAMAGAGVWHLFGSGRFGAFADAKTSFPDLTRDQDYCPVQVSPCTVADIQDLRSELKLREVDQYVIVNAGLVIRAGPEVSFLIGAGRARHSRLVEFADIVNDPEFLVTEDGTYWAPGTPMEEWSVQAVVGALMRLGNHVVVRFGYETKPGGLSLGGYLVLPR